MADSIIAFAFGNRSDGDGRLRPGPVNAALAAVVVDLHRSCDALIWAQWEIAEVLVDDHGLGSETVVAVGPSREPDGELGYLSTRGVAESVVASAGGAGFLGQTTVVAHCDHIDRCLRECLRVGIEAAKPIGVELPVMYDPDSGQPWTRTRSRYLEHEAAKAGL